MALRARASRGLCFVLLLCTALGQRLGAADSQPNRDAEAKLALAEKNDCTRNLKLIYEAIQSYQEEKKDLPNWLSDLVPQYLPDANVLVCPVCRRTGATEPAPLADPKLPCSYLFEFCPVPLGNMAPNAPERTRREWKRRQMGLVGSMVPIIRCRHHRPVLNVAFDGRVYESTPSWEQMFTNRVNPDALSAPRLFAEDAASAARAALHIPVRSSQAAARLLDLTKFYTAGLKEAWLGETNGSLAALPQGVQTLQGVQFDLRGLIQLAGRPGAEKDQLQHTANIPVWQKCKRIHFLHAAAFGQPADNGKTVGSYFIHFAKNPARLEIPIVFGRDVQNWRPSGNAPGTGEAKPVWTENGDPKTAARLFLTSWVNLAPDLEIESVEFVSNRAGPAPFLVAVTSE